jgi:hypothetical protein
MIKAYHKCLYTYLCIGISMVEVEIDASTGDEIILITRRGRPFLVLRDRDTKRFIRFLRKISIEVTKAIDYDSPRGRGNNLYLDVKATTDITPDKFEDRREIALELSNAIDEVVLQYFGSTIAFMISKSIVGVEYSSLEVGYTYPYAKIIIAWGRDYAVKEASEVITL